MYPVLFRIYGNWTECVSFPVMLLQGEFPEVDVSAGLAFCPEECPDVPALIRLADERMYTMKDRHHREGPEKTPR